MTSEGRANAHVERSEVARSLDLSVIRYSRVWEDCRVLSKALQIKPDDDIISITRFFEIGVELCTYICGCYSSGDNVLSLLLEEPKSIGKWVCVGCRSIYGHSQKS